MEPRPERPDKSDLDPPAILSALVEALNNLKLSLPDSQEELQSRMEGGGYRVLLSQIQPAIRELHTTAERAERALPAASLARASNLLTFATQAMSASAQVLQANSDEKAVFALHNTVPDIASVLNSLHFEDLESQALEQDRLAFPPTIPLDQWASLSNKKQTIVLALQPGETQSAKRLAQKAKLLCDSHFNTCLRELQSANILDKSGREGDWFLLQAPPDGARKTC